MLKKIISVLLSIWVTAVLWYVAYLQFTDTGTAEQTTTETIHFPASDCDPEIKPCTLIQAGRQLSFSLPEKAAYLQKFPVEVSLKGFDSDRVESVRVRFEMPEMDMGVNQLQLVANNMNWAGETMLPVCVSGSNDWRAIIDVDTDKADYRAVFDFAVKKDTN